MKLCFEHDQIFMPLTAVLAIAVDPRYKALDIFHRYPTLRDFQQQCLFEEVASMLQQAAPVPELVRGVEVPPNLAAVPAIDPAHKSVRPLQRQGTGAMQAMVANVPALPLPQAQERRVSPQEVIAVYRAAENMASDATQGEVLEWFRARKSEGRFAIMLQVAERCIFIPVASAPSERVASTAGQTYTKRRIRLLAPMAEAIIVLHEAKGQVAYRIVQMVPELIRESLERAVGHEAALENGV